MGHPDVRSCIECCGGDGSRAVAAVVIIVERIAGPGDRIDTVNVVNKAVAIVIYAVARDLTGVDPHVTCQILMCVADAGIDHADHH